MAVDARLIVEPSPVPAPRHLIIAPYPNQYESDWMLRDGTPVLLRPMKPEDEPLVSDFLGKCSEETIYFRYFKLHQEMDPRNAHPLHPERLRPGDGPDGHRPAAGSGGHDGREPHGHGRGPVHRRIRRHRGRPLARAKGLGPKLVERITEIAREQGVKRLWAAVLSDNHPMLALAQKQGFSLKKDPEGETVHLEMTL